MDEKDNIDVWACMSCEGSPSFERAEMMQHLQDTHGINPKTAKSTRQMILHMDGSDWFQSNYKYEINGIELVQQIRRKREKNDPMGFGG